MRHENDAIAKKTVCIKYEKVEDFVERLINEFENGTAKYDTDQCICIHADSMPRCISTQNLLINNPVLASDGAIYEKDALEKAYKENNGISAYNGRTFDPIFSDKFYVSIRIACKEVLYSKIDPRRILTTKINKTIKLENKLHLASEALVFFGEVKGSDAAVLFVEQWVKCADAKGETYIHGLIDTYRFHKNLKANKQTEKSNAQIEHKLYRDTDYSLVSQASLFEETFNIDKNQLQNRTFACTQKTIEKLQQRIQADMKALKQGKIDYSEWGEKLLTSFWGTQVCGVKWYTSCSWARAVLRDESVGLLRAKNEDQYDDFPIFHKGDKENPYQPICVSSWMDSMWATKQSRICPRLNSNKQLNSVN